MRSPTASGTIVALTLAAAVATGCGEEDKQPTSSGAAAAAAPTGKPTATDLQIVRLVQLTGGRLHLDAIRLLGDRALLADEGALDTVAAARLRTASQLEREATAASEKLESLGDKASAATAVAAGGKKAFDELASCGRQASAFFRKAQAGKRPALSGPAAVCKNARLAYGQANTLADALKASATPRTTDAGAPR